MKVYIDADGCPVVKIACNIARKYNIEPVIICDTSHNFNIKNVKTVIVSKGADSADFKLVNMIKKDDIAITQDYGLAAMCLAKKAYVINQNGLIYNDNNIMELLNKRHIGKMIRKSGGRTKGPKKRDEFLNLIFMEKFVELIEKILYN